MKRGIDTNSAAADAMDQSAAQDVQPAPGERLLLAALQAWAAARSTGERPNDQVTARLARKTSPRTAALFTAWIQAIEAGSRRPIEVECPGCGDISADLQRLVVACGVAPVSLEIAEALLAPLVSETHAIALLGRSLGVALDRDGWRLPVRLHQAEPVAAVAPAAMARAGHTLH